MPTLARLFDRKPEYEVINPAQHLDALAAEYSGHQPAKAAAKNAAPAALDRRKAAADPKRRARALQLQVQDIASRVKAAVAEGLTPRSAIARGALSRAQSIRNAAILRPAVRGAMPPLRAAVIVAALMAAVVAMALASPSLFVGTPFAKAASPGFVMGNLLNAGRAAIRNPGSVLRAPGWGSANTAGALNRVWHLGLHQPAWAPAPRTIALAWRALQPFIALALFGILTRAPVATRRAPAARNAAIAALGAVLALECVWGVFHRALHSPAAALAHAAIFACATVVAAAQCFRAFKASGVAMLAVAAFACAELARHAAIFRMN